MITAILNLKRKTMTTLHCVHFYYYLLLIGSKSQMPAWFNAGQSVQRPTASSFHHDMSSCFMIYGFLLELLTQGNLKYGQAVGARRQWGERVWHSSPTEGLFVFFLFLTGVTSRDWSIAGTIKCLEGISVISSKYVAAALAKEERKTFWSRVFEARRNIHLHSPLQGLALIVFLCTIGEKPGTRFTQSLNYVMQTLFFEVLQHKATYTCIPRPFKICCWGEFFRKQSDFPSLLVLP